MKKNRNFIILGILFVLFNIIVFTLSFEKNSIFWIGYLFTTIAFASQGYLLYQYTQYETLFERKFLGFAFAQVNVTYLIVQLVSFSILIALKPEKLTSSVLVYSIILAAYLVIFLMMNSGGEIILEYEDRVEQKVNYLRALDVDVSLVKNKVEDQELKTVLNTLEDELKYSDPMSSKELEDIELSIKDRVDALKSNIDLITVDSVNDIIDLVKERNSKTKLYK